MFFDDSCAVCPLYETILCKDCSFDYPDDPEDDEEVF